MCAFLKSPKITHCHAKYIYIYKQDVSAVMLTCKHHDAAPHKNAEDNKLCLAGMSALKQIDESIY